jgi:putative FmdB family regulatory protein
MPFFNFHCPDCDATVELLVSASDTPSCPTCGASRIEKLLALSVPPGTSKATIQAGRSAAARAGHLSNFGGGKK